MPKKYIYTFINIFLLLLVFITSNSIFAVQAQVKNQETIYFFYGNGCPHCSKVEEYFQKNDIYTKYSIESKEIYFNKDNAILFNKLLDERAVPDTQRGVPTLIVKNKVIMGDTPIINYFESNDKNTTENERVINKEIPKAKEKTGLTLLAVIGASLVDAINPCAFAVLIILMMTILTTSNNKKALISGLAFSTSIFISYLLMGLGLYKALEVTSITNVFYNIIGWIAIILGLFNLKDWIWYDKGFLMEVPKSWRPKLKSLIRSVTNPFSAFLIGFLVSLILLPCTSGPYIVILAMLAEKTQQVKAVSYLIIYNLIFVSPMVLISYLVYKGLDPKKAEKLRQKHLQTLHLVAGIILLIMGILIITKII
jgi:cytochrome c biogenesis protein CcdA/glutaredoxin